jgi:serine protease
LPTRAIEYYRPALDHYFITGAIEEIAKLDAVAGYGEWVRTGQGFDVWPAGAKLDGVNPVCRFYGKPEKGLDSHFYSASAGECQAVKDRFADWVYESGDVFGVPLPNMIDGTCPAGTKPVFRLFNNRSDANHRYTTSIDIRNQMRSLGWIAEGYGPEAVAMCAQ